MRPTMLLLLCAACTDVENPHNDDDNELITRVELTLSPEAGGDAEVASWSDPEADGNPLIDALLLSIDGPYVLEVAFFNDLAEPSEEITAEVAAEAAEHQVFFTGEGVLGPATGMVTAAIVEHQYADEDSNGLPIGLLNRLIPVSAGTGEITVRLRHLPPEGNALVKVPELAETAAADGFAAIGGDDDVLVTFPMSVDAAE